jgi:hypothetical protein
LRASLLLPIAALIATLSLTGVATAQPQTILAAPKPGSIPNVTLVPIAKARAGTLSESQGVLAFCHDQPHPYHVSYIKLDAKGEPSPATTSITLPPFKIVEKNRHQTALAVALHPKLPLLYVWQDTDANYGVPTLWDTPEVLAVEHLLIYRIDKETPELVVGLCRGRGAQFGMHGGGMTVDPAGEFLYVPNLCEPKTHFQHAGRFKLDADGLPILNDADVKLPLAERIKKIAATDGSVPTQQTPAEYVYVFPMNPYGCAHSFHLLSKDAILIGSNRGVFSWRPGDPVIEAHHVPLPGAASTLIAVHPTLPVLFATRSNTDSFYRLEHVEGYLTLMPRRYTIPETTLHSFPAILPKAKKLAVGGKYHVYFMDLDDEGRIRPEVMALPVLNQLERVLLYSEKHDRLYVAVEVSK